MSKGKFQDVRVGIAECQSSIILVEADIHASAKTQLGEGCHGILEVIGFLDYLAIFTVVQLDGAAGLISGMYYTNSICQHLLGLDTGCLITHQKW